jgi:hypothetical protein
LRAEGIPAKLIFRDMDKFTIHSLDAAGNKVAEIKVSKKGSDRSFNIGSQHNTLWYILTRK